MPNDSGGNGQARLWEEIRLLRARIHKLAGQVSATLHLVRDNRNRLEELEPKVNAIATADAIAEGVADKLNERDDASESRLRVWSIRVGIVAAVIGGTISVVDVILRGFGK